MEGTRSGTAQSMYAEIPSLVSHSVLATQAVYSAQLLISDCCRKALIGAVELVMGDVVDGDNIKLLVCAVF